ncbi:hypothetical protein F5Y13DRAFT_18259 [Hypoxylon sp. FL1857]|nr:hypothetical protein F5Y13DRAFT_18259 [Hypoxylon sp. FL1857]
MSQMLLRNICSTSGIRSRNTRSAFRVRLTDRVCTPARARQRAERHVHHQPRTPQPPNPIHTSRRIIWPFIGANGLVFLWWTDARMRLDRGRHAEPDDFSHYEGIKYMLDNYTLNMKNLREGRWYTILSSTISHINLAHLVFNMISFNAFTRCAVEIAGLRAPTILLLGLGSAVASGGASILNWYRKGTYDAGCLGASGVVSGIGAAMACIVPNQPFNILFIPVGIPLWVLMVGYITYDSYGLSHPEKSNIGHAAHLGGAAFGVLYYVFGFRLRLRRR